MRNPEHLATLPDLPYEQGPSSAFLTQCHRNALERLNISFSEKRPLAILIGDGRSTSRFVIRRFLSRLDQDVAVAQITEPCANAIDFMGIIISAIGFQPKDMNLEDLESIFSMFLSFQKGHCRRTIICIEEAQASEWWVLDKIRSLVEMERENQFGLTLILSGQPELKELLHARPLSSISDYAGKRISLEPFTLPETREYIRRRLEAAGAANIDEAFQFHAIPLIHELCAGIPDAIGSLVSQCLGVADQDGSDLITKDLVKRAYESLRAESEQGDSGEDAAIANVTNIRPRFGRLIVQLSGDEVSEVPLRQGNILIGRSKLCDIRVNSRIVSRHHALISYTSAGGASIVDLGSTNGTSVDGHAIKEHVLTAGETITVGNCRIEYVIDDALQARFQSAEQANEITLNS
jgi:type II secretory pathway predicted ATPase ExeA